MKVTPWRLILAAGAAGAYLVGLVLFLPAEAVTGRRGDAVGTVWNGQMALDPGFAASWVTRPWTSLISLAPTADVAITGPETDIKARTTLSGGKATIIDMSGSGSTRLLNALAPALPFACDGELSVSGENLGLLGGRVGSGQIRTGPMTCAGTTGATTPAPPLTATLASDPNGASLSAAAPGGISIGDVRTRRDGAVAIKIAPAASGILPGVTPATLETTL